MHLRQDDGEIAPVTWLGGAVSSVTIGGVILLAERQIGTAPAFIVFWLGCALAALCLFGAGRQHFINIGSDRERSRAGIVPVQSGLVRVVRDASAPEPTPAAVQALPLARHFINETASEIVSLFDSHTTVQGDKLVAPYLGKWLELSGAVADVQEQFITLKESGDPSKYVSLYLGFDEEWRDRFIILRRDQPVRVVGEIGTVYRSVISLKHCELVPLTPSATLP